MNSTVMPRAFLIKKKSGSNPGSTVKRARSESPSSDNEILGSEVSYLPRFTPLPALPTDMKGPYDLSMKPRVVEERSPLTELVIQQSQLSPSTDHHRSSVSPPPGALVAPKPIKPVAKPAPGMTTSRTPWQRMSPYMPFNYSSMYPYHGEIFSVSSSYLNGRHPMVPPPLVPLSPPTSTSPPREDRFSPFEVPSRTGVVSPPVGSSPSPPAIYSGWASDGQDSGLASSPSPSSEDGETVQRQNAQTRYQCSDCNKSYSTYSGLSKHKLMHCSTQAKKSFSCKYCEKVYVSLGALKMHIRTHTLPCKCKLCGKAFSRPWLLQGHIRTHTGEKPFSCPHCSRAFADRSNLRAHLQTHSEVKKYRCKTCSKTFSRMSLLLKHEDGGCAGALQQQQQQPML